MHLTAGESRKGKSLIKNDMQLQVIADIGYIHTHITHALETDTHTHTHKHTRLHTRRRHTCTHLGMVLITYLPNLIIKDYRSVCGCQATNLILHTYSTR